MYSRATKTTRVDLVGDKLIESGESIIVSGIIIANEHTAVVSVDFDSGSGALKFTVVCPPSSSVFTDFEFLADGGLNIDGLVSNGDLVVVSVFHSAGGM